MEKKQEYKQAVLVGAAPMGQERAQLVRLLQWARPEHQQTRTNTQTEDMDCGGNCNGCHRVCDAKSNADLYLIAVDGGITFLFENGIQPDLWIGDMDSVTKQSSLDWENYQSAIKKQQFPVEKDDTDMALAVADAYEKGYREILLYGGVGGTRLSHTFANIQLMQQYEAKGCHIRLMAQNCQAEILRNGVKRYSAVMQGKISVICLSDRAEDVVIEGLQYEYQGTLTNAVALGVSNAFAGKPARISVGQGVLLLIYEK
jgi:thiamine pyrophosphokinase